MKEIENSLKEEQQDWRYLKQQLLLKGVDLSGLGNEDYFEFVKIWNARPKEERVMSSADAHKRLRGG